MKNSFKIVTCFALIFSLIFMFSTSAFASERDAVLISSTTKNTTRDYYDSNYSEVINIDGIDYQFTYYYDELNNRCVSILNMDNFKADVISYHNGDSTLYQNGKYISDVVVRNFNPLVLCDTNWIYFDSASRTISHLETLTAQAFASAVAVIIGGYCKASDVFIAVGLVGINDIISHFESASVESTIYKFNSNLTLQFRYDWSLTPVGGSKYGPYMTLSPIM